MGSGNRRVQINTRERAVSVDIRRAQSIADAEITEMLRALLAPTIQPESSSASVLNDTVAAPLEAHILHGLMVIVPVAGSELAVQAGKALVVDPDATPDADDSPTKLISSEGVALGSGTLAFAANASGSVRVDVVECSRNPDVVQETDTRDVMNPSTGTYTPTLVDKVVRDQLTFRIRQGVGGAGFPGVAAGWVPLAVYGMPSGAVDFDDCTFWDVRPLVAERDPQFGLAIADAKVNPRQASFFLDVTTGVKKLTGTCWTAAKGYKLGGKLSAIDVGTGSLEDWLDLIRWKDPALAVGASTLYFMWLLTPFSLPRWQGYGSANDPTYGGRVPAGVRGIPCLSAVPPTDFTGTLAAGAIQLPIVSGLEPLDTATEGMCIGCVQSDGGSALISLVDDGIWQSSGLGANIALAATAIAGNIAYFDPTVTEMPPNAKAIRFRCVLDFTGGVSTAFDYNEQVFVAYPATTTVFSYGLNRQQIAVTDGAGNFTADVILECALPPGYPVTLAPRIGVATSPTAAVTLSAATMYPIGYRF